MIMLIPYASCQDTYGFCECYLLNDESKTKQMALNFQHIAQAMYLFISIRRCQNIFYQCISMIDKLHERQGFRSCDVTICSFFL